MVCNVLAHASLLWRDKHSFYTIKKSVSRVFCASLIKIKKKMNNSKMKRAANQTGGELWLNFLRRCQRLADGSDLFFPDRGAVSGGYRKLHWLVLRRCRISCFRYRLLRLLVLLRLGLRVCAWFSCHGESCWSGRKEEGTRGERDESAGSLRIDQPSPATHSGFEINARMWRGFDRRIIVKLT